MSETLIDCDACPARGPVCGQCVVALLVAPSEIPDADELAAISALVGAGLVRPPVRVAR